MKKIIFFTILLMAMAMGVDAASLRQVQLEMTNEYWDGVTTITQISVFDAGTSSASTIFSDRAGTLSMVNPITTSSTNTTFDQSLGTVRWFQRAPDYKVSITDGSKTLTIDNLTGSQTRFPWFDNYIGTAASLSVGDNESINVGSQNDAVLSWVNASDILNWIPAVDGVDFNIGSTSVAKQFDFNVFVGGIGGGGLAIDEGASTFGWTGGVFNINVSSDFATNINTGTSTGAVNIGNSASGAWSIDGASTGTINSDGALGITTTDGSADITIDATAGSVNLVSGENAAAAISLVANVGTSETIVVTNTLGTSESAVNIDAPAGGIDIDFATAKNMAITGGQFIFLSNEDVAGAFSATTNTGTSETIVMTNTQGTGEDAFNFDATAGGMDFDAATGKNIAFTGGQFIFTSNEDVASAFSVITNTGTSETITLVNTQGTGTGAVTVTTTAAGDIDINSGDDITIDAADDMTTTVVGDYTLAVTGTTTLPANQLRRVSVAIADTEMDILAATPKELVAAVAGNTIEFVSAVFALDWVSVAWTEPSAPDDLVIRYTDGSGAIVSHLLDATGFATATEDTVLTLGSNVSDAAGADVAKVAVTEAASTNKALVLHNTGAEWTNSGDSQVVVIVYYRLHSTAELGL